MKSFRIYSIFLVSIVLFVSSCHQPENIEVSENPIVPLPLEANFSSDQLPLKSSLKIVSNNRSLLKLQSVLNDFQDASLLDDATYVDTHLNERLQEEYYELEVSKDGIRIEGGSYKALVYACNTLLQLTKDHSEISFVKIKDKPAFGYRGVMLDLSRNWHDVASIKQVISLASWYKMNYVQLHLTDDALFTFQSKAYPKLASKQSYTPEDLKELNEYAKTRGIILVPEIDVPGHSSGFIRAYPKYFGLEDVNRNPYTLNMGNEVVYKVLEIIIEEVAKAFPDSPYIHLGGDEVFTAGFDKDKKVQKYLKSNDLENVEELYRHFLMRMSKVVQYYGKTPILWSGFEREGTVEIPKDVIIMNWKPGAYTPKEMMEDGYQIINASWKPLYVVNNRKWTPEEIYNWTPYDWKGFATPNEAPSLKAPKNDKLLGGSMSVWEQNQYKIFESLKKRLPAVAERLWNPSATNFDNFANRVEATNSKLEKAVFPFEVIEDGLTFGKEKEPNFREDMWFQDTLRVTVKPFDTNTKLYYSLDGTDASMKPYNEPIVISKSTKISIKAFKNKKPLGLTYLKDYRLVPVKLHVSGLVNDLQPNSWERHKFLDSVTVELSSKRKGQIKYTTDNSAPIMKSRLYTKPFTIKTSGLLRVKLFDEGKPVGSERREEYEMLIRETSLTTGKKVTTSNKFEAGVPGIITDGKITRWDHWGAHTDGNNWVIVDLEKEQEINAFKVYTFWDNYRYYEYTIEVSSDQKEWKMVVDQSKNRQLSTPKGQLDSIQPTKARYLKLNLIRNSANPGLHLVEFQAF